MVLFVDDVDGGRNAHGSGSTDDPIHTEIVTVGSPDTGGYECHLETKDGRSATCRINGDGFDLSNGALFVVKSKGQRVEVHQLKRELTNIPFDAQDCRAPIEEDAEIRKLLGVGDMPN